MRHGHPSDKAHYTSLSLVPRSIHCSVCLSVCLFIRSRSTSCFSTAQCIGPSLSLSPLLCLFIHLSGALSSNLSGPPSVVSSKAVENLCWWLYLCFFVSLSFSLSASPPVLLLVSGPHVKGSYLTESPICMQLGTAHKPRR